MIKVENLSKSFGKNTVLEDINLELKEGRIYGIIGKNGAGKTTLFRCIAGLEKHEGEVKSDFEPLKDHTGLLLTTPYFLPKITGEEHLQLLLAARGIATESIREHNIFGLPLAKYAETYSTGMKKKLALTAILLQQNDIFILDEPFNGVDLESNILLIQVIKELKNLNKTLLISSHLLNTLSDLCDEIFLLEDGRIQDRYQPEEFDKLEYSLESTKTNLTEKLSFLRR